MRKHRYILNGLRFVTVSQSNPWCRPVTNSLELGRPVESSVQKSEERLSKYLISDCPGVRYSKEVLNIHRCCYSALCQNPCHIARADRDNWATHFIESIENYEAERLSTETHQVPQDFSFPKA
jgi:hypothetical protein